VQHACEQFEIGLLIANKIHFFSETIYILKKIVNKKINKKMENRIKDAKKVADARWNKDKQNEMIQKTPQETREQKRLHDVYGDDVEQDALRNKANKFEVECQKRHH